MTDHLAPTEILADYASGAASPGVSLLVASHLTYSAESRAAVAAFEGLGGALFADQTPEAMAPDARERALELLDAPLPPKANGAVIPKQSARLPAPILSLLDTDEARLPWRFRLPGVSEYELPGFGDEHVSLLRARPGAGIPQHTHEGTELTLILSGEMEDGGTVYRRGDVAVNTEEDDHRPRIRGTETCICLIVMDGGLRFTGRFSRALNVLAE